MATPSKTIDKMNRTFSKPAIWTIALLFASLTSCKVDRGEPCIGKEEMASIIYDYYIAEGTLDTRPIPSGHQRRYYYCNLLEKHGVSEAEFDSALCWYSKNSDIFTEVHELVTRRLKEEKTKLP